MRAIHNTIFHQQHASRPSSPAVEVDELGEVLRRALKLAPLLEPFLSTEQIQIMLRQAAED